MLAGRKGREFGMKVALVTGAGKRVGRAISLGLAERGWHVVVHYNTAGAEARSVVKGILANGGQASTLKANLESPRAVGKMLSKCSENIGPVTCLINNAALFKNDNIRQLKYSLWNRHIAINLRAPVFLIREFARFLPNNQNGVVINVLDQKIVNLDEAFFSYTISKIGLEGVTRSLAIALAPRIRVCGVALGFTLRGGTQTEERFKKAQRDTPLQRGPSLDDVVNAVNFILNTPSFTGRTIVIDGGQSLERL